MDSIKLFDFKGSSISSIFYADNIYFLPEEIGAILGFEDLSDSIQKSDGMKSGKDFVIFRASELKDLKKLMVLSRPSNITFPETINSKLLISEKGLYKLILRSRKLLAEEFQDWVTGEVLPSIRTTGAYITPKTTEEWLADPDIMIRALQELKKAREEKAWIGSRREATAMATASSEARKRRKLEKQLEEKNVELCLGKTFAATINVSKKLGYSTDAFPWRPLKKYCEENNLSIRKEFNAAYGEVNCYPSEAWKAIYGVDL